MYLIVNKWVIAVKVSNFSGHYLRNHRTWDIGVLGYIGIVWPKEHSPEVRSFLPGTPCIKLSLSLLSSSHWNSKWSIVWSVVPQRHIGVPLILNRCKYDLMLPCPRNHGCKILANVYFHFSFSCDRGLHRYLRNFRGGGVWTPQTPPGTPLIHTLQSRDLRLSPDSTKLLLHARYTWAHVLEVLELITCSACGVCWTGDSRWRSHKVWVTHFAGKCARLFWRLWITLQTECNNFVISEAGRSDSGLWRRLTMLLEHDRKHE